MQILNLGNKREVFWDDYLVDTAKTTAFGRMIPAMRCGNVFDINKPWSARSISYPCIIKDEKGYKMYYFAYSDIPAEHRWRKAFLALLESPDGYTWDYSKQSLVEFEGEKDTNILGEYVNDNFFVFIDPNPACPPEEKYKAVASGAPRIEHEPFEKGSIEEEMASDTKKAQLWYYTSPDGYHFKLGGFMTEKGAFDTLNTVTWQDGLYTAYIRNYHYPKNPPPDFDPEDSNRWIRGISVTYSKDFQTWSEPEEIKFTDGLDYPLYTNQIEIYPRAPHLKVGFPVRYCERRAWTENFEQLPGKEPRQLGMKEMSPRAGLAVTDAIFMYSRDGKLWNRYNESFVTPGYEHENGAEHNWCYGDCYLSYGMIDDGQENYIFYDIGNHRSKNVPRPLIMYKVRKDGFACYMADGNEKVLVTKPLIFDGKCPHINFTASPYGYIYMDILAEDGTPIEESESFEIFGDNIDRRILRKDGKDYAEFAGKPIRLRFRMLDAKLFSIQFAE